jgi:glycosyltransferase involved in cell wall biosynthesis
MRFCMITTFYPPYNFGGDGIFVQRLSHALARRGHSVEVIHCVDSYRLLAGAPPRAGTQDHPDVVVHALRSRYGPLSPLATHQTGRPLLKAPRLREILARPFDVINFHNISLVGGPGVLAFGNAIKLYTLHDYWLTCPTHVLFRNRRVACTERKCLRCILAHGRPPQLWRHGGMLREALRQVDAFIVPTRFVLEKHAAVDIAGRTVLLPHFAPDPDGWQPTPGDVPSPSEPPGFLFVGRLERLKGLQTILPIFRRRSDLRLTIAGTGTYERDLRRMAGDAPNIRFLGRVGGERLRRLYQDATAVVIPSLCYEIYSLVVLEAFSQGTPVLAREIGSLPEMVADGARGLMFTTPAACEQAMDRLQRDSAYRAQLSRRCLESCRGERSVEAYVEKYLEIISTLGGK